ncbi:HEPN domain-containing protein [Zhouia amylolytica]|uniref:HEPN domain-containing protein n=1 Tax=Zhouia amylolytica TaxID=376730 RepID=UPI0020CDB601|nr:HEPN domain-containing protein [Zhouia amylolytica]MCQ0112646.1 HEPN domain-containing protein [Zhouia amylolytica]
MENQIVSKITGLLEVQCIYLSELIIRKARRPLYVIILTGNCSSLTRELATMVAKIFQEGTTVLYRIFSLEYASQQLKDHNLFFMEHCRSECLKFSSSGEKSGIVAYAMTQYAFENQLKRHQGESNKIEAFKSGAEFFRKNQNHAQAAFMFHQYIELWYRYLALSFMGKERKSHSIKELQVYLKAFIPELGTLFNSDTEEDQIVLKLLDEAYVSVRYKSNYHVSQDQLIAIQRKANTLHELANELFQEGQDRCLGFLENQVHESDFKSRIVLEDQDFLKTIKSLVKEHYRMLDPHPHRNELFRFRVNTKGYLETSFMIASLIKVCALALDGQDDTNIMVKNAGGDVKEVLTLILNLMPYEEMRFLDKMRSVIKEEEVK